MSCSHAILGASPLLLIVATAFAGFAPQRCAAKDWFLDAQAKVNGNGTEASPWNDLDTAARAPLQPGDRLRMKGTYTACTRDPNPWNIFSPRWSGTRDNPIVVENWPGFQFVMDGRMDIKDKGWNHLGDRVYQSAWKYFAEHYYPMAAWHRSRGGAEHVLELEASRARDATLPPDRMRLLKDRTVLVHLPDDSDPAAAAWLKVPNQVCGIDLVRSGADHITFRNFAVHDMASYGIQTKTTGEAGTSNLGITFDTLDIGYVNDRGISQNEGDDYHKPNGAGKIAAGTIVRNCTVHHCGQEGIRVAQDTEGAVIADNTVFNIQQTDFFPYLSEFLIADAGCGIRAYELENAKITGNRVYNVGGGREGRCSGINLEYGARNVLVEDNEVKNVLSGHTDQSQWGRAMHLTGMGTALTWDGIEFRNNRIHNCDMGFVFEGAEGCFHNGKIRICGNRVAEPTVAAVFVYEWLTDVRCELLIADNAFIAENTAPKALVLVPGKGLHAGIQFGNFENNRFYSPKNTARVLAIKGEDIAAGGVAAFGPGNRYGESPPP